MPTPSQRDVRNRLLTLMSPDDYGLLAPHLAPVDLPKSTVLAEPDQAISYIYFMDTGVGSVLGLTPEGQEVEIGLFGRDGVIPTGPLLGSDQIPHRVVVQIAGAGWSLPLGVIQSAMGQSLSLRGLMLLWVQCFATQSAYTAVSNAVHPIDERLARWILMCDDRCDGDIRLTHEYLAVMLAVRRPSVTTSLHVLEGNGFIRSERGCIVVRNRAALEDFARDAYGKPEAEYRRLIGSMR